MARTLTIDEIQEKLGAVPHWGVLGEKSCLVRKYTFKDWQEVMAFIHQVSEISERLNHHPNIHFTYGFCKIEIHTHDAGGITQLDFELASCIDSINPI